MQKLQFNDFSGGLTDRTLPGQHNMYSVADNMLIEHDKSIYSRDGFDIYSNTAYQLTAAERVAKLINFNKDSELLAVQNKQLQYLSAGAWTNLLGPTTNKAFNTNTAASLIDQAQWNQHLYLASDSGDPVIKYYRDSGAVARMRTAGLPKPSVTNNYQTTQGTNDVDDPLKITAAIALAVDIKTQLQAHVNDYGVSPAAHIAQDLAVYNALNALTTPTNLATLITYTKALRTQYNAHVADARLSLTAQVYHIEVSDLGSAGSSTGIKDPILNILADTSTPSDVNLDTCDEVIRVLNNLRTIYNLHALAPITHNNATQTSAGWGAHLVTVAQIDTAATTPATVANLNTFLNYVNYLKAEYNAHAANVGPTSFMHAQADSLNYVRIADATDLCTGVALLGCLYYHYGQHIEKANAQLDPASLIRPFYTPTQQMTYIFKGDVTNGNATIANVTPDPSTFVLPNGYFVAKRTSDITSPYTNWRGNDLFALNATVSSKTATTIVMSSVATGTTGTYTFAFHWNGIHTDVERSTSAVLTSSGASKAFLDIFDPFLEDLSSCGLLATTIAGYFKAHEISGLTAITEEELLNGAYGIVQPRKNTTYYAPITDSGTSEYLPPHVPNSVAASLNTNTFFFPSLTTLNNIFARSIADSGVGYFEAGLTVANYLYKQTYRYAYTVGTKTFVDESEPSNILSVQSFVSPADATSGSTTWADYIGIAGIPVLTNASNQNWDTSVLTKRFYRTIGDGTVYYLAKEVSNATTSLQDFMDDTNLILQESLYTNGGVVGNGLPPSAKFIHVVDNRMYYATGRLLYQSLSDDPDSVPSTFFDTFDEDITGLSSTRSNLVVFTAQNVYRVDGVFDELGQGFMRHEKIFDTTGNVAPYSPVKTDVGVFFLGKNGVYYTDGFQCFRITQNHDTFTSYVETTGQKNAVQGVYNQLEKKLYFVIKSTDSLSAPDMLAVYDIHFGVKVDAVPNTKFSGGFDAYTGFNPTSLCVFSALLVYGDSDGYILKQTPGVYVDRLKNTGVAATSWDYRAVLWDFKTCNEDFGSPNFRKYFTRLNTEFEQYTNISVQIRSDADKGRIISDLPIIRSRKLLDWGDSKIDWTSSVYTAKSGGVIDEFRRFKGDGSLRSNYRAIEFRNAYCVIAASDQMGNINVTNISANLWALTLINTPTIKWPLYSVGYFVRINSVDYPITVRTSDSVVRVSDSGLAPLSVQSNIEYEIWGYPKNEKVNLNNFDINYEFLGQLQKDYGGTTTTDGGENA